MAAKTKLNKNNVVKELFGSLKGWKINTQKFKDERRVEDKRNDAKLSSLSFFINRTARKSPL